MLEKESLFLYNIIIVGDIVNVDVIKEINIEYCENLYALGVNYLKNNNNKDLEVILDKVAKLEECIRKSEDINELFNYKYYLEQLSNGIEVIINA